MPQREERKIGKWKKMCCIARGILENAQIFPRRFVHFFWYMHCVGNVYLSTDPSSTVFCAEEVWRFWHSSMRSSSFHKPGIFMRNHNGGEKVAVS